MEENKIVWQADNLPSNSKLWVRQVKKLLLSLTKQVSSLALETSRSFKTFDTNLGIVTRNARASEELLLALQGTVAAIPITRVVRGTRDGFGVPGLETTQITVTIPWEEGKTRCDVIAVASTQVEQNADGIVTWRINIHDTPGTYTPGWNDGLGTLGGMAQASATVTGIAADGTFNVVLRSAPTSPFGAVGSNSAAIDIMAVFS